VNKGIAKQLSLLFAVVGVCAMLTRCVDGVQVGELQQAAQVRCEFAKVWAGPGDASPLPQLKDCGTGIDLNWHNLPDGGWVMTDDSGEAWIDIGGCLAIYRLQYDGELLNSGWQKGSGAIVCSISGTSVYNNNCSSKIVIQTSSAQVVLGGTWLSVTYLPEIQLALILVAEGEVEVQPVLNFDEYTLGDPISAGEGYFLFTAPGEEFPYIAGLPRRTAIPFEELPPVVEELMIIEPNLERWLERIRVRSDEDDVPFPGFTAGVPCPEAEGLLLAGVGDLWTDERVQPVMLHGVDWVSLTESTFDHVVPVAVIDLEPSGEETDLSEDASPVGYDPQLARTLLEEAGLAGELLLELAV
jgi:hypothetical protein